MVCYLDKPFHSNHSTTRFIVDGHDSQEDATAALKLILWKIGEDLKKFKRWLFDHLLAFIYILLTNVDLIYFKPLKPHYIWSQSHWRVVGQRGRHSDP